MRVPYSGDGGSIDFDTDRGRAVYQQRLAFINLVGTALSLGIMVMLAVADPRVLVHSAQEETAGFVIAMSKRLVFLLAWLLCRRKSLLPLGVLRAIDGAVPFVVCTAAAVQAIWWPGQTPAREWAAVLAVTNVLMARALFIPSPPWRTMGIGLAAALPAIVLSTVYYGSPAPPPASVTATAAAMAIWSLCAVAISTLASATIYGLHRQVREARQLGPYTLERKLGEGGMGVVYRARHAMLRRPTAVKFLPVAKAGEHSIRRFEREVQLTAQLTHPNTISVFDYGRTPDGVFFYAMEYLEGVNLEELVREFGAQPAARVVHILRQVAGSLGEAHRAGLVHRDVKPANVILCERGGVPDVAKVLDFGLARDVVPAPSAALTQADAILGTPLYLAPEAISAPGQADPRSDIYALGALAYYLLAGVNVFEAKTVIEVCSHHLHTPPVPPSRRLGRPLPCALEALVMACLEKDPAKRPQSGAEFTERLLACFDVGVWDEADARAWWAGHGGRARAAHARTVEALPSQAGAAGDVIPSAVRYRLTPVERGA
jgi:eukaryotic-like serine/threonine-protein kinase